MGRRLAAVAVFVASGGLVGVAVSATSHATAGAPAKTTTPSLPGTPTTASPTVAPPPTLWPPTTVSGPTTSTTPSLATTSTIFPPPPVSIPPTTTATAPTTGPSATTFDAFTFLRDFYGQLALDPFAAAGLADQTALGSTADAFLFHEVGVAAAIFGNTSVPLPAYTVTANGLAVDVCRDDGACESFSDFVLDGTVLSRFAIDGQPMDERTSSYQRQTTVEALTIEASFAVRRPRDELLSVVVLIAAQGGGTSLDWGQAAYLDATGRQYPIEVANSEFPVRIEDGGFDIAHVSFAGAQHGGQLVIPITTDLTGVATTIRVPVTVR